jgi:tetratricopeptide (TPR) repeat protein
VINAEAGSSVFAVLHGDIHIRNGNPVYQVEKFPLSAEPVPLDRARDQPSRLLAADAQVVPFSGRAAELAQLAAWRDASEPGVSVMLMHAPGGQGKTRLAARFAADSAAAGWTAWAAHHLSDPTGQHVVVPGDPGRALVLIIDYADRWPVDDLLLLLDNALLRRPERTRVLLVSRPAGTWWSSLRHRLDKAGIAVGATVALPPLAPTVPERRNAFSAARRAFAAVFGTGGDMTVVPRALDGDAYQLVLTIHMAALVLADAQKRGAEAPTDPVGLSAYLLDREHDFWQALHDHEQIVTNPRVMGRTVYSATLTRSVRRDLAVTILGRLEIADPGTAPAVLNDHAWCYPSLTREADSALEPLYPDRLGEDFLALTTPGHSLPDYPADPWARHAPDRLLISEDQEPLPYVKPAVTALVETAHRWPHVAQQQLYPLLRRRPQIAIDAGGAALMRLVNLPDIEMRLLEAIEEQLPSHRNVDLDAGIAVLTARLTDYRLTLTQDPAERASLYHALGKRFSVAGLYQQSLTATRKAVEIRRPLAAERPAEHAADLALSLNNLGSTLSDLGLPEQGITATEQAVDLYRQLTAANPPAHEPGLAMGLSNLAAQLLSVGRTDDALAVTREAVEIRRRLADDDPAAYLPDLALSIGNFGVILGSLGRRGQALTIAEHAADVWSRLAASDPAAYAPDFARALTNLGADLADAHRPQDALRVTDRAVGVYRQLAAANRVVHEPGLAMGLSNLAGQLRSVGRADDALAAIEEAVEIRQRLAAENRAAYQPALAASLDKYGVMLAGVGRDADALTPIESAAEIRQQLAAGNPAVHEPALAESLTNLAKILSDSGNNSRALTVAKHAVSVYRRLAAGNPAVHEPGLARSLGNIGMIMLGTWRQNRALAPTAESVSIYRRLALADDAAYEAELATALRNFAVVRASARKELPEALAAAREAIQILGPLAEREPVNFTSLLLETYHLAAAILDRLGNRPEAEEIRRVLKEYEGLIELPLFARWVSGARHPRFMIQSPCQAVLAFLRRERRAEALPG